jgi:hypothetical protein
VRTLQLRREVRREGDVVSLQWQGRKTVLIVSRTIARKGRIVRRVAPELNHALFRSLHRQARQRPIERVDRAGDAGLLRSG